MHVIEKQTVERVWEQTSQMDELEANQRMMQISEEQPALLAYVMAESEELSDDAQELAVYLFVVVHSIFRQEYGSGIPKVSMDTLMQQLDQSTEMMEQLVDADDEQLSKVAESELEKQPWVEQCLAEALVVSTDSPDALKLTDEEQGQLYFTLNKIVHLLDEATSQ